jgi:4-carboxymuconolactone decarboxylase
VVELTGVIGYYTMVSMTLNAHEIPLAGRQRAAAAGAWRRADPLPRARSHPPPNEYAPMRDMKDLQRFT